MIKLIVNYPNLYTMLWLWQVSTHREGYQTLGIDQLNIRVRDSATTSGHSSRSFAEILSNPVAFDLQSFDSSEKTLSCLTPSWDLLGSLSTRTFKGDAAVIERLRLGRGTHDIPRTVDVVLPATTRVEWSWRRSESREWFKRILTFYSFFSFLLWLIDFSRCATNFVDSFSLITLIDQAEITTGPDAS